MQASSSKAASWFCSCDACMETIPLMPLVHAAPEAFAALLQEDYSDLFAQPPYMEALVEKRAKEIARAWAGMRRLAIWTIFVVGAVVPASFIALAYVFSHLSRKSN